MIEKFDIKKTEKELKQIAKESNTKADAAIFVIIGNMEMYNDRVNEYRAGDTAKVYLMYQLNASIFKQLALFGLVPPKVKATTKTDDNALADIIKAVNQR